MVLLRASSRQRIMYVCVCVCVCVCWSYTIRACLWAILKARIKSIRSITILRYDIHENDADVITTVDFEAALNIVVSLCAQSMQAHSCNVRDRLLLVYALACMASFELLLPSIIFYVPERRATTFFCTRLIVRP